MTILWQKAYQDDRSASAAGHRSDRYQNPNRVMYTKALTMELTTCQRLVATVVMPRLRA